MTNTIPYEITGRRGDIEFRSYPDLILATVESSEDSGFNILFAFISGKNKTQKKISMTSPVITSSKIAMTAPVFSDKKSMSFVMPPGKRMEEIPLPLDSRVHITELPGREVAIIRFNGYAREKETAEMELKLNQELKETGTETKGETFLMRYNPPWIPGFMRHNEIGIEILRHNSQNSEINHPKK